MRIKSLAFAFLLGCLFIEAESMTAQAESAPLQSRADTANTLIAPDEAIRKIEAGALLVDVRHPDEFSEGHLSGALNIPHDLIEENLSKFGADKNREIVLYCRSGRRAGLAQSALAQAGFKHVFNAGGYEDLSGAVKHQKDE